MPSDDRHASEEGDDSVVRPELDTAIAELRARKRAWSQMSAAERLPYLRDLRRGFHRTAEGLVQAAAAAQGIPIDDPRAGELWIGGPFITLRWARLAIESLQQIERYGTVRLKPSQLRQRPDGQVVVRVFPAGGLDRVVFSGFTADVWLQPGIRLDQAADLIAVHYKTPDEDGTVILVLGAGNVSSIAPLDVAYKLFGEGKVVLLKLNPVNDYLRPLLEDIFSTLIADGFVRIVSGDAAVGDYLCTHPGIEEIHITGSEQTHDAIVWGTGQEAVDRRTRNRPRLNKLISSELGNVSPVVVVPGKWSPRELEFHAENLATQMTQNGGFNCNAAKVIVTHKAWAQRAEFLDRLKRVLGALPPRSAYYPGAAHRYDRFLAAYPHAESFGPNADGCLQPALAVGVSPEDSNSLAFTTESFCAFTVETAIDAPEADAFLRRAVEFCNGTLHGTLNAGLIVDPETERRMRGPLDTAVADLRYGSVAINHWPAMAYAFGSTPWGGYPGHDRSDIQSGSGFVHNALFLDRPQKSVARGPFRVVPRPPWFVTHRKAHAVGQWLVELEAKPSMGRMTGLFAAALRG